MSYITIIATAPQAGPLAWMLSLEVYLPVAVIMTAVWAVAGLVLAKRDGGSDRLLVGLAWVLMAPAWPMSLLLALLAVACAAGLGLAWLAGRAAALLTGH